MRTAVDVKHTAETRASERRRNRQAAKARDECHSLDHFVVTDQTSIQTNEEGK